MENNNQLNKKDEILALILADMRSRKLIMGLDAAGLSTDDFNTDLSVLILSKLGVAKEHEILMGNRYEDMIFHILDIDMSSFREHQLGIALTIYNALESKNRRLQSKLLLKLNSSAKFLQWAALHRSDN